MNAYSEDLRKKIVEAVQREGDAKDRGRQDLRCGHLLRQALHGDLPRGEIAGPEEAPRLQTEAGRRRERKLLEANLEEHPEATLPQRREFLRRVYVEFR
jgi:hypothetical protein